MQKFILILTIASFLSALATDEVYPNVLSAAKCSDAFLIVKINRMQQVIACYSLPRQGKFSSSEKTIRPFRYIKPGSYMFPIKQGLLLNFKYPYLLVKNPENIYSLLLKFKQLPVEDEGIFLINNFLNLQTEVRFSALKRLQEIGFFNSHFNPDTTLFFRNFYTNEKLSVPEKRLLLENLATCNFNKFAELYILALSDHDVSKLSGHILNKKNRKLFSDIIKKYISNEKLWKIAIKHANYFIEDQDFVNLALQRFDYNNPQNNSADFIPLLLIPQKKSNRNAEIIKKLLVNSKNTKSFELYKNLAHGLNYHSDPIQFREEIMQFIVNNKKNQYIADGIVYPTMLLALKKSGHSQANKLLRDYLVELKNKNNRQLTDLVCVLFKNKNQQTPNLDFLINTLK